MEAEINLLRKNISKLVENEIKPEVKNWEEEKAIPEAIYRKLAEMGIFGLAIPEEYGGIGYGAEVLAVAVEELARGSASLALTVLLQNSLVAQGLILSKNTDILGDLAEGKILGGGGIFDNKIANEDGKLTGSGDFLINGIGKIFVLSDRENAFIVKEGIDLSECPDILAYHTAHICNFQLDGTTAVASISFDQLRPGFDLYLIGLAAISLGIVREILYESKTYAKNRRQFGKPIIDFWMVQDMLAEIATAVRASELMVKDAAVKYDQGKLEGHDAPMVKTFVTNRVMKASTLGIQIFGGYGYTTDYPMERYFRETKVLEVLGMVNEELRSKIIQSL